MLDEQLKGGKPAILTVCIGFLILPDIDIREA
jgi:hypothetical protein